MKSGPTAYGIGIDTGGTYTDAVLFDLGERQVIRVSKRPTIHHCLERSIVEALDDIFPVGEAEALRKIAFSTTLATNAIAEGRTSKVGLIVIGQVKPFDAPVVSVRYVEGGHDHLGKEVSPLNIEQIVEAVGSLKGHVDAYAIAASLSIENQTHEQVAAKAIELVDRKPVVCSSGVSTKAGIRERAATAVLHASLMPVIQRFVAQVNQLKKDRFPNADMRIIRGDATADSLTEAVARAAGTVASGPAATAWFGAKSTAARHAIVVDIGGTTTDITFIKNGKPVISQDGSLIDRWRTHIDAVDMHTVGIGGDSLVRLDRSGQLRVGPLRVQPLAMARGIPDPASWIGEENRSRWIVSVNSNGQDRPVASDPVVASLLRGKGATPADLIVQLGMSDIHLDRRLEDLAFENKISWLFRIWGSVPKSPHGCRRQKVLQPIFMISGLVKPLGRASQSVVPFYRCWIAGSEVMDQRPASDTQFGGRQAPVEVERREQVAVHSLHQTVRHVAGSMAARQIVGLRIA